MKTNVPVRISIFTHEGGVSSPISPLKKLKRICSACLLWEDTFYVNGKEHTEIIEKVCTKVEPEQIVSLAIDIHTKGLLRHIPLFLLVQALKRGSKCVEAIITICSRPDQMTELLSLYWKDGKKPLASQLKKGLARAFCKFDEYQLAKYNRDGAIKLKDILFLCHAKPVNEDQEALWKRLISNTMKIPETWETRLSSGEGKKEAFQDLLEKKKMGKLAVLRNMRNFHDSGVSKDLVRENLLANKKPLLPFQFLAAARECPSWEDIIDESMISSMIDREKLQGITVIFVDVSSSMNDVISNKSLMTRFDAAAGICILLRETCEKFQIFSFSSSLVPVPPRQGMALRDAIQNSQVHAGTYLGRAIATFNQNRNSVAIDRMIVITDEQTHDQVPNVSVPKKYILNVGTYENGISNYEGWDVISGFSQNCIDYILEIEKSE